jgi:hypothetical protein
VPLLPSLIEYDIVVPVVADAGPDLDKMMLMAETVVAAEAQLAVVQVAPGVGGLAPPVMSTDA